MQTYRTLADLRIRFPCTGEVMWLGLRPLARGLVQSVTRMELLTDLGPRGDHGATRTGAKRQVSLIQAEHLLLLANWCGLDSLDPALLRRNIVVTGINLLGLRTTRFCVGDAILEGNGYCHPCSRMEEVLGPGGYNAMRGHGGITARVIGGGEVALGDPVRFLEPIPSMQDA